MKLQAVLAELELATPAAIPHVEITGVVSDSRKVRQGSLFVCVRGLTTDGHFFAGQAVKQGAAALVVDHLLPEIETAQFVVPDTRVALAQVSRNFFGDPCSRMSVVGVTGTAGKTSVSFLYRSLMEACGQATGLIGPVANILRGEPSFAVRATPEANDLLALLDEMAWSGTRAAVIEVSSQGIRLGRIAGCAFSIGIFANLYSDFVGMTDPPSFGEALDSKIQFARSCERILVCGDAEHAGAFLARLNRPAYMYGLTAACDIRALDLQPEWRNGRHGTRFVCSSPWYEGAVYIGLPGRYHVVNALAALAAAALAGMDPDLAVAALAEAVVPGSLQPVASADGLGVYVDTARTPQTLLRVLIALRAYTRKQLTVVFGCNGNTSPATRAEMGRIAAAHADRVVIVPDNPYLEDPARIAGDIAKGFPADVPAPMYIADRAQGIYAAFDGLTAGDAVVITGKGHKTYQMYAHRTEAFSDMEHAALGLAQWAAAESASR